MVDIEKLKEICGDEALSETPSRYITTSECLEAFKAFVEEVSPAAVLELIAENERFKAERDQLRAENKRLRCIIGDLKDWDCDVRGGCLSIPVDLRRRMQEALSGAGAAPMSQVDVAAKLESMAASHGEQLNWRTSIVDLLKLLGLDSSLDARRNLATELGCPPDRMADSAEMNTWLHHEVMRRLADTTLAARGGE